MNWYKRLKQRIKTRWISYILSKTENDYDLYQIEVKNTSDTERGVARLFGYNLFYRSENFGSDPNIKVSNLMGGNYETMLAESQKRTQVGLLRVNHVGNGEMPDKTICYIWDRATGKKQTIAIRTTDYMSQFQIQRNMVDINLPIIIDGSTYAEIRLEPKERFIFLFFKSDPLARPFYSI